MMTKRSRAGWFSSSVKPRPRAGCTRSTWRKAKRRSSIICELHREMGYIGYMTYLGYRDYRSKHQIPSFPTRCVRDLMKRCNPVTHLTATKSFISQRLHRIDSCRAPCGQPTGEQRDSKQEHGDGGERQWIRGAHA